MNPPYYLLILVVKISLASGLLATFGLALSYRPRLDLFFVNKGSAWLVFMWIALRLVPFLVLYQLLGFKATSDLIGFYNGAVSASQGLVPYRDFTTVYAPFFAYLTAIPLLCWHDARAIIVLMMLVEGIALWATYRLYRLSLSTTLLYLLLPSALMFCVIGGQEDIWMWGFGLLTIPLLQRNRTLAAGVVLGLALVITKALFVLFVPVIFVWVSKKKALVLGMSAVGVPVLAWLYTVGKWSFLMPIQLAQEPLAPNIHSVLHPFLGNLLDELPMKLVNYVALLGVVGLSVIATLRWKKADISYRSMLARAWVFVYALIMLLVPSAYAVYAFGFMLPLITYGLPHWQRGRSLAVLVVFNFLAVIQPTTWWGLGRPMYRLSELTTLHFLLEYLMQVGIVACLLYFVVDLWPKSPKAAVSWDRRLSGPSTTVDPTRIAEVWETTR